MLTAKLCCYSREEADLLKEILETVISQIAQNPLTNCGKLADCENCKARHVCSDVKSLYGFLLSEAQNGYPHLTR